MTIEYYSNILNHDKSGVYLMTFDNETYVGSTTQKFYQRWVQWVCHFTTYDSLSIKQLDKVCAKLSSCNVKRQCHASYVASLLQFVVLEVVEDFSIIKSREQYWIDTLKPTFNQNNAVQPEYYYTLKSEEEKAYNYKISAQKYKQKRIQANRKTYIETYIVPITSVLDTLDPKLYTKGKWHLAYKGQVFKFPKLSTFVNNHNLNRRVLESIAKNRFDYKLPLSLKNTKSRL